MKNFLTVFSIGALSLIVSTYCLAQDVPKQHATSASPTDADAYVKSYELRDLQRIATNAPSCKPIFLSLKRLAKHPIQLHFSPARDDKSYSVTHTGEALTNHSYAIVKQNISDGVANRTGMGTFEVDGRKLDYVIVIASNAAREDFKHLYPVIISSEQGHCFYTAVVKPSAKTVEDFKKHIQSGAATQGADLHKNANP